MNLDKIIEEIYDYSGKNYSAYSEPPRKDFSPMSNKAGYDNPYQQSGAHNQPTTPEPEGSPSMPWPLQTASEDVSDSFVFLVSAINKMISCVKLNPSLDKESKKELLELYKKSKKTLSLIKEIGLSIGKFNMAKPQPLQNPNPNTPDQRVNSDSMPNPNPVIAIKLP